MADFFVTHGGRSLS